MMFKESKTDLSILEYLVIRYKQQEKQVQGECPCQQPGRAHHQRPQQVHDVPGAGDEHFRTTTRKMVSEDGPDSWKLPLHLPAGLCSCPQQ